MKFRLVHIHIGKTGGTSLARSLTAALGPGVCSPPFVQSFMNQDDANYYNSFPIVHGHISRIDQIGWFPDRRILTMLRDPIKRGISFLRYVRSLPPSSSKIAADANTMRPLDIIDTEEGLVNLNNTMVRQLGGHVLSVGSDYESLFEAAQYSLRDAIWVGRQDDSVGSLKRLSRFFGVTISPQFENVTPHCGKLENQEKIEQKLSEANEWDQKLWDWAKKHIFD